MKNKKSPSRFGIRDKLGYLFGDFGNDFTFRLSSTFLLKFYTDVIGVDAAIVGIVMMVARFIDAFTDVTMGRICDNSKITANGKFKPWILRMSGPVAIASFLMYQSSFANAHIAIKIVWLSVTYILWSSVFYTSVNIPYGSMASAISDNPDDRQSLSTFRTMGGLFANIFVSFLVPLIAYDKIIKNGEEIVVLNGGRFTVIAGVFSIFAVICYLLCYRLVTERVHREDAEARQNNSVGKMLLNAFRNRALISIIVASVLMLIAQLTMQQMASYVFPNYYRNASAQAISTLMMGIAMSGTAAFVKPICKKYGKAEISIIASIFSAVVFGLLLIIRPANVWIYVLLQGLCWLGNGVFSMINWALITDVIDYSEIKNGVREDGGVYALYSFARKLGQALAVGLTGALLTLIGYNEATAFDRTVLEGVFNISTKIPGIAFLALALVLWFWYPLHKKQVDKNVAILKKKHGSPEEK